MIQTVKQEEWLLQVLFPSVRCTTELSQEPFLCLCSFWSPAYDFLEGFPEISVKNCVYYRVHWAVAITDPKEKVEKCARYIAAVSADSVQGVSEKEREPAKHEHPHDHRQNEGEALLPHLGHFGFVGRGQLLSPRLVLLLRVQLDRPCRSPGETAVLGWAGFRPLHFSPLGEVMISGFSVRRTAFLQVDVIQLPLSLLVAAGALAAGALHLEPVLPDEAGLGLRWLPL